MANSYIGQVHIGDNYYKIGSALFAILDTNQNPAIGSVTTSGSNTTFYVPLEGFNPIDGITVHIQFQQANSQDNNTTSGHEHTLYLKVGNSSSVAYPISNPNGAATWSAGSVISFTLVPNGASYKWIVNSSQIDASKIQIDVSQLSNLSLGNITSEGNINQSSGWSLANGDGLIVFDSNNSNKIERSSIVFDASTESQVLSKKGTWVDMYTHPTNAGNKHIPSGGSTGQFLKYGGSSGTASWASFSNLILKIDAGTTEGTDLYTYNGNSAKTLDIKSSGPITFTTASSSLTISHSDTDGNKHVPATGTTHNGHFLKAGSTAGSLSWAALSSSDIPDLDYSKITSGTPTTLEGYNISDASIDTSTGVITLGSNTITPITSVNNHTGPSVILTAGDLGLTSALRFKGTTISDMIDGFTGVPAGITDYTTPIVGDVVLKGDAEYVCISVTGTSPNITYTWELLGRDSSFALSDHTHGNITSDGKMSGSTASGNTTTSHKFLREDGTWAIPKYTTDSGNTKLRIYLSNTSVELPLVGLNSGGSTPAYATHTSGSKDVYGAISTTSTNRATINLSTGAITATLFKGALQGTDVKTALGYDGTTANTSLLFLHKSGDWKTLQITNTTTTVASVENGVLTLVASVAENAALGIAT